MPTMKSALFIAVFAISLLTEAFAEDRAEPVAELQSGENTVWTTGAALMPAWGFYPLGQAYNGTKPLQEVAAWNRSGKPASLTWVHAFDLPGKYHVWARQYGGIGQVEVFVDEQSLAEGKGGPGGARYVWTHLGTYTITKGRHHVDVAVPGGMLDAILFTLDADLQPEGGSLPDPVEKPVLRALRTYRDDVLLKNDAGVRGFIVGSSIPYEELLYDWIPKRDRVLERVQLWGAANQYVNSTFAVRMLDATNEFRVSLNQLAGPDGVLLAADEIDLRVVHVRERKHALFRHSRRRILVPELLLRDDRTALPPGGKQGGYGGGVCVTRIPAHHSRQFWLTVRVPPESPPGLYRGEIILRANGGEERLQHLPIELEVLPLTLLPAEGYYGIYYPNNPAKPTELLHVSEQRFLAELKDQVRHGLNATTLYGGFSTISLAKRAGMTRAPCLMHWPGDSAQGEVEHAKKIGLEDLYYYGVDEPRNPAQIERCRKEAERRAGLGLHMLTAINSTKAQLATRDFVDRPVYNIYVFGGKDNSAAMYAREKGFRPISYWTTATIYPLWYRAFTGLYNKSCGYLGSSPWAYRDAPDERIYDPDAINHQVSYPDEFGEPIPTLAWEAHRAGINDVRYLETLDRAIAAAKHRLEQSNPSDDLRVAIAQAQHVRQERYESIRGRWFEYVCSLRPGELENSRREFAEAIVQINRALAGR
ncbi:hypothetical protein CA54_58060 [Symmachiella macrocystis]|uniref:Glycoside hydrolase 123 C-terminal domain-containing protein n=1 Tax=Symmachiella macrocystis TaxID=2527985 RepID=A0A5C6AZP2_9PLAN|nr:hypothetical protein [Symmachiella macrocystis]TWU05118.1 hypothetical protein CA54_58060 [Symmachiella macrocystis]